MLLYLAIRFSFWCSTLLIQRARFLERFGWLQVLKSPRLSSFFTWANFLHIGFVAEGSSNLCAIGKPLPSQCFKSRFLQLVCRVCGGNRLVHPPRCQSYPWADWRIVRKSCSGFWGFSPTCLWFRPIGLSNPFFWCRLHCKKRKLGEIDFLAIFISFFEGNNSTFLPLGGFGRLVIHGVGPSSAGNSFICCSFQLGRWAQDLVSQLLPEAFKPLEAREPQAAEVQRKRSPCKGFRGVWK